MIKVLSKVGDRHKLNCGCEIMRGQVVSRDAGTKRPIHEVILTKCVRCKSYDKRRSTVAEVVYQDFKDRGLQTKKDINHSIAYLAEVEQRFAESEAV